MFEKGRKRQEACRRKPGGKNVGVCRFGAGVGEEPFLVEEQDKKSTRTFPKAGVFATAQLLTLDLGGKIEGRQSLFSTKAAWKSCSLNSA